MAASSDAEADRAEEPVRLLRCRSSATKEISARDVTERCYRQTHAKDALLLRLRRYTSAMATIQIRNVPDTVHRIYQVRAAAAGMSLQEYLLLEIVRNAGLRSPAELVAEVENRMRAEGAEGFAPGSSTELVRADREAH